jgi:hypothetical protein
VKMLIRSIFVLMMMWLLSIVQAQACSSEPFELFKPNVSKYITHKGEQIPPTPIIHVGDVRRGRDKPGSSCADMGYISITIELPEKSAFSLAELGFKFRVVEGDQPDEIFSPNYFIMPDADEGGKVGRLGFAWLDGHPKRQKPLSLMVEVVSVANNGTESSPVTFLVTAPVGKPFSFFEKTSNFFGLVE